MECEHGRLHQNTEFCRVDFQPLKSEHNGPQVGRLLVSTFQNPWTALLRFDAGDLARLDEAPACPCGRTEGYRLLAIEGRLANATFTTSGRLVSTSTADAVLAEIGGVRDYQLVQTSPQDYTLRLVVNGNARGTTDQAHERLAGVYGSGANIQTELQAFIEPTASGKFRRTYALFAFNQEGLFA
jgi:phenylacetate-coenzyme A ligase PaaK-like adenylate-forming protein